jgi:predicted HTH domain antitoxin
MTITLPIPDELVARLGDADDVARRALEAFALAEYQAGRLFESDLSQLLGVSRYELDGLLKARGIFLDYTLEDVRRDLDDLAAHEAERIAAAKALAAEFRAFRRGRTLGGLDPKALIREGLQ